MKKAVILAVCLLALAACDKQMPDLGMDFSKSPISIVPVMTRATETSFEDGDAIGLTVSRASGNYAENSKLVYNGLEFSSDLLWYPESSDPATLAAYYPYADTAPTSFTVELDQRLTGIESSDFVAAYKDGVLPTGSAVVMPFKHRMTKLVAKITNNTHELVTDISFGGVIPKANLAPDFTATADLSVSPEVIYACLVDTVYTAILPPQTVALVLNVYTTGKDFTQKMASATLEAGKKYTVNVIVNEDNIQIKLSGAIDGWEDGGSIDPETTPPPHPVQFEENLDELWFTYDNVKYDIVVMMDDRFWMASNLRYVPYGYSVCTDLNNVTAGVYAPVMSNGSEAVFSTNPDLIEGNGYLYQAEVALGLKVGDLKTEEDAKALEGAQGICPPGWRVPTIEDIIRLVGKAVSPIETNPYAPYYNGSNGSIVMLNNDGFNMDAYGFVSIQDNTKTSGTIMGFMSTFPDRLSTGMFCGSSFAGITYKSSGDPASGVKNIQFYGFMPMTNKVDSNDYTCNGTMVSYRIAAPLRCVRNEV